MSVCGIFDNGKYLYWLDECDGEELKDAIWFLDTDNRAGFHSCEKSVLYDDMTGYVDALQDEESCLDDGELYVVVYHHAFRDNGGYWNIDQLIDFGLTKDEIIENVKNQKYVEGATYHTMGQMFFATRMMTEHKDD